MADLESQQSSVLRHSGRRQTREAIAQCDAEVMVEQAAVPCACSRDESMGPVPGAAMGDI